MSEKLGTCDHWWGQQNPHKQTFLCRDWRELPAEDKPTAPAQPEPLARRSTPDWINGGREALGMVGDMLKAIPIHNGQGWDRYDTDNQHVLHIWADGKSYDIRIPKDEHLQFVDAQSEPPEGNDFDALRLLSKNFIVVAGILVRRSGKHEPTDDEWRAINYLCDEWDYGYEAGFVANAPVVAAPEPDWAERVARSVHARCELWARSKHTFSGEQQIEELAALIREEWSRR